MEDKSRMSVIPSLEAYQLSKAYDNGNEKLVVLDNVSLSILPGQTCAIVGPSGSGKTTLLGLCAGLDRPTTGEVLIDGTPISQLDQDALARLRNERLGFVFQNFQLLQNLTGLENVMVPLELRGDRSARKYAIELLDRVGLKERLHHYPSQLSGGEQQRVALARAFVNQPKLLFADEPTGNLDGTTSENVVDLIFELNRELGTSLVLVTHDLGLADKAHRVIRLKNGRILEDSSASNTPENFSAT